MKEIIKKNELVIFEKFKLRPEQHKINRKPDTSGKKLKKLILLAKLDGQGKPLSFWKKENDGTLTPVDNYGCYNFSKEKPPKEEELKKFDTKLLVYFNKYNFPIEWWGLNKLNKLFKLRTKNKSDLMKSENTGLGFEIKSWIRNEAIKEVSLEMRTVKKRAYEYEEKEIEQLIIEKEDQIKKNLGWKTIKTVVLASLGLNFI